jgi:hypothetical protein
LTLALLNWQILLSNKVENSFEKLNVHKPVDVQCCFLKFQHHQNLQATFNSIKNVLLHCGRCESNKLHSIFKKGQFLNMNVFDFVFRSYWNRRPTSSRLALIEGLLGKPKLYVSNYVIKTFLSSICLNSL